MNQNNKNKTDKKKQFIKLLEEKIIDFGTLVLKNGITNVAVSQLDNTEQKVQKIIEEKIQKHSKKIILILVQTISLIVGISFLIYGILELFFLKLNISEYLNFFFGLVFLIILLLTRLIK